MRSCWWSPLPRSARSPKDGDCPTSTATPTPVAADLFCPARTGKTTAITQLGKTLEVIHRQRHPHTRRDIPVVYITVPPSATAKMIAIEFARFLGLPTIRRANITDIIEAVCGVCIDTRTGLIAALEHALRLHHHRAGTLVGLADYLHHRTTGMIGSLLRLIRSAAIQAILDGTEQITRATLNSIDIDIDIAAEKNNTRTATVSNRRPRETSNS